MKSRIPFQLVLTAVILSISCLVGFLLVKSKPEVKKEVERHLPPLVEVINVEQKDEQVVVQAFGTVQGSRQITLYPEVSGLVIEQSPEFGIGGLVEEGQILLQIDPRDYLTAIEQEKAAVKRAEYELMLEQGRCFVAEKEWKLLDLKGDEVGKDLALHIPQLQEKKAALDAANSRLERAKINLERTVVRAPFNAIVTQGNTDVGQLVSPQIPLATLVATDEFRVQVSVPYEQLKWLNLPYFGNGNCSEVKIIQEMSNGESIERVGVVSRLLGDVDPSGRMTRVLVKIPDPLGLKKEARTCQPLLIGTFVRVNLYGPVLKDVVVLPRSVVRDGDHVWIYDGDNALKIIDINIAFRMPDSVVINEGLESNDQIIVTALPLAVPGMQLRKE